MVDYWYNSTINQNLWSWDTHIYNMYMLIISWCLKSMNIRSYNPISMLITLFRYMPWYTMWPSVCTHGTRVLPHHFLVLLPFLFLGGVLYLEGLGIYNYMCIYIYLLIHSHPGEYGHFKQVSAFYSTSKSIVLIYKD